MKAEYYELVYLVVVAFLTIIQCFFYYKSGSSSYNKQNRKNAIFPILFVLSLIFYIGFRPVSGSVFADMRGYEVHYYTIHYGEPFSFSFKTNNIIFDNLFAFLGFLQCDIYVLFFVMAFLYFMAAFIGIKRLFPNDYFFAYLIFLAAFSTFSYGTNGIKAGVAASFFILALSYYNNIVICLLLIIISYGFHHSMHLPIFAFAVTLFVRNTKYYIYIWITSILVSIAHIGFFQEVLASVTDDSGAEYLLDSSTDWGGKAGFRLDFVLYSSIPLMVWYFLVVKNHIKPSKLYTCLINTYLLSNSLWILCMYAQFTNRIAYLSWFLLPIVLVYPLLKDHSIKNQYQKLSKIALAHLFFTIFMYFMYY